MLTHLCGRDRNPVWLPYPNAWAEWVLHDRPRMREDGLQHIVRNSVIDQQLRGDALMMSVMTLAKIGLVPDRPRYVEEAKYQFLLHARSRADGASGRLSHDWTFDGHHDFARALRARGNSRITIVMSEFIEPPDLPEGDPTRRHQLLLSQRQARALHRTQHASGL